MAITYTWIFDPLEVTYSSASLDNVVTSIHWRRTGTTEGTSSLGRSGSFSATNIGVEPLGTVASADFVAYESLTEALVTGWITASLGDDRVTEIQTNISGSLVNQISPARGNKVKPW